MDDWERLTKAWRKRGSSGLTPAFLCAATGTQPEELLRQLEERGACIAWCEVINAPIVYLSWRGPHLAVYADVVNALTSIMGGGAPPRGPALLYAHLRMVLESGKPSKREQRWRPIPNLLGREWQEVEQIRRRQSMRHALLWRDYTPKEVKFVTKVLGKSPYRIVGIGKEGRILYAPYR